MGNREAFNHNLNMILDDDVRRPPFESDDWVDMQHHQLYALWQAATEQAEQGISIKDFHLDGKGLRTTLAGGACHLVAEAFADQFKEECGVNYVQMEFSSPYNDLVVIIQKLSGVTPAEKAQKYKKQIESLQAQLKDLIRCAENNTGHEPSLSVFHRAIDEAKALLSDQEAK